MREKIVWIKTNDKFVNIRKILQSEGNSGTGCGGDRGNSGRGCKILQLGATQGEGAGGARYCNQGATHGEGAGGARYCSQGATHGEGAGGCQIRMPLFFSFSFLFPPFPFSFLLKFLPLHLLWLYYEIILNISDFNIIYHV